MGLLDSTPLSGLFYNPSRDKRKALEAMGEADAAYRELNPVEFSPVSYEGPELSSDVRVDPVAIERSGPSAYEQISTDPTARSAQTAQLAALENLRQRGGMTAMDEANLARLQSDEAAKEKAQREAIMTQAQMKGNSGSGMALMALLNSNQAGTNRLSQRNMDIAGMAQDRSLKASGMAADLAGGMQRDDFNRQAQVAAARDQAARFNTELANRGAQFNAQQQQQAALSNMNKTQGVYNQRASAQQAQEQMNKFQQPQAAYNAKLGKAQGMAGNSQAKANFYNDQVSQGRIAQGQLWNSAAMLGAAAMGGPAGAAAAGAAGGAIGAGSAPKSKPLYQNTSSPQLGNDQTWEDQFKYAYGGGVPGEPVVEGDSPLNDYIPATLSPGEVVVPRSMTQAPAQEIGSYVHENSPQMRALQNMKRRGR
jgi:hypothetical protein